MCGIAGFAGGSNLSPAASADVLGAMCDAITHRGPDDVGTYIGGGVAIGMRRLSIIDLATGRQPMTNEDETVRVVFNGEIYNFRELRKDLAGRGHRFSTMSDTEVIVHAYEEWGERAFARLRGMFAIALWDGRRHTLLLVRDRAGIKPVYYAGLDGRLLFGSEIKAILAAGMLPRRVDLEALDHYLSFLYTPGTASMFRGISKLPPGHLLRWMDGRLSIVPYWELPATERLDIGEAEAVERLRTLLVDAVSAHMVSDVPLGAFLSGGVDSSTIVAVMAEQSGRPVKTFSIGFDEADHDELSYARIVARRWGTEHHEVVVRPDALQVLDRLIEHFDEPFADASAIPTWYVSEMARRHVTVVLSGDGGDELFGGYDRYLPHPRVRMFDRLAIPGASVLAGAVWPRLPHGWRGKNFLRHVARDRQGRYLDAISFFQPDEKRDLFTADVRRALDGWSADVLLARHFDRFARLSWPAQMMRFDFKTYLPEDVLTKVDRMSMAHSIESRVPLLDNELIEYAAILPAALMIQSGRRKHLLKQAASRWLPVEVLDRRKQGFRVPLGAWMRGPLRPLLDDVLLSQTALSRGYFDPSFIRRLVREHASGRRDHALRLWQLLVFELWHQHYLDVPPHTHPRRRVTLPAALR